MLSDDSITFQPLARAHFLLLERWLAEPHVAKWWNERLDLAGLENKYGPRIDGFVPAYVFTIEFSGRPIGWIQWYRWRDYAAYAAKLRQELTRAAGIDITIGEVSLIGQGIGPIAIRKFVRDYVFTHADIDCVFTDPETSNLRSVGAFGKAGFAVVRTIRLEGESSERSVVVLRRIAA
jgi:aminoglycoside 6'-N-acetyltransferase